ncbi:MAG: hypothetical protein U9N39_08535 [Campylobacterota bacterium]|nr:hypothetical protein [Campylobacterota bacterium]
MFLKKELLIFLSLFIVLAIGMHYHAWMYDPLEHIFALPSSSLGVFHPLYLTFGLYIFIGFIRLIVAFIKRVFFSKAKEE